MEQEFKKYKFLWIKTDLSETFINLENIYCLNDIINLLWSFTEEHLNEHIIAYCFTNNRRVYKNV